MKLIIAGSRTLILPTTTIAKAVEAFNLEPTELVCGMATGVDTAAWHWAKENKIPVAEFPALWDDLEAIGALLKERPDGTLYNVAAGPQRNQLMANYGEVLLVLKREQTNGTDDMVKRMKTAKKPVYTYWVG